jgi:hypothetical protein
MQGDRSLFVRTGSRTIETRLFLFLFLFLAAPVFAQNAKREAAFSFAYSGQVPIAKSEANIQNFFTNPLIFNLRYQVATDYVNALSMTIEHISEDHTRAGLWNDIPNASQGAYNADITERLYMTTLGLEGIRTLVRTGDFRLGAGIGIAYGLGGATATVKKLTDGSVQTFESCDTWSGFEVSAFVRGRYTLYQSDKIDIGLTGALRFWGFPAIGPLSTCQSSYNGPDFRSLHEIGYLAGISVGFY